MMEYYYEKEPSNFLDEIKDLEKSPDKICEFQEKIINASPAEYAEFVDYTQGEILEEIDKDLIDFAMHRFDTFVYTNLEKFGYTGDTLEKYYDESLNDLKDLDPEHKHLDFLEKLISEEYENPTHPANKTHLFNTYLEKVKNLTPDDSMHHFMTLQNRVAHLILLSPQSTRSRVLLDLFMNSLKQKVY